MEQVITEHCHPITGCPWVTGHDDAIYYPFKHCIWKVTHAATEEPGWRTEKQNSSSNSVAMWHIGFRHLVCFIVRLCTLFVVPPVSSRNCVMNTRGIVSSRLPGRLQSAWDLWLSREVGLPAIWDGIQASQPAAWQETPNGSVRVWRPTGLWYIQSNLGLLCDPIFQLTEYCCEPVLLCKWNGVHICVFRCSWWTTPSRGWSTSA